MATQTTEPAGPARSARPGGARVALMFGLGSAALAAAVLLSLVMGARVTPPLSLIHI